jgi:ankyrin repeat protein
MIQEWFRYKKEKIKESRIKEIVLASKRFLGAQGMQCLIRRKIARARVNRIRLRRLYLIIFMSATRIESLVRKFLCRRRVYLIKMESSRQKAKADGLASDALEKEKNAVREAAEKSAVESGDLLHQAKVGGVRLIELAFTPAAKDLIDEEGNTLLHIAAKYNQPSVLQKCFELKFDDFERRNASGLSVLMVAVDAGNLDVVKMILEPPMKFKLDRFMPDDSAFLWCAAMRNMNQRKCLIRNSTPVDNSILKMLLDLGLPVVGKHAIFANGGPMHATCELGDLTTFRHMLKNKAPLDQVDDNGNCALHCAVQSSLGLVKLILGLDSSAGILVPDSKRAPMLMTANKSGKDCRLLAAIAGQTEILEFATSTCNSNREAMLDAKKNVVSLEWLEDDMKEVLLLAESGNEPCLRYVIESGKYDVMAPVGEVGVNLVMWACKFGHMSIITMLLEMKVNFMAVDSHGMSAMHYAAMCKTTSVIAELLSNANAYDCGIDQMSVTLQDHDGSTPLHVASINNVTAEIDLLASHGVEVALNTKDSNGMTPLLLACKHFYCDVIKHIVSLDRADMTAADNDGHNALWHLSHSDENRPLASELRAKLGLEGKQSKADRQTNAARLAADIETFTLLVGAGCALYTSSTVTVEDLLASPIAGVRDPTKLKGVPSESRALYDAGDLIVQDMSLTLLKGLPQHLSRSDSWRLMLSCIRYDEGTNKSLVSVIEGGIADVLASAPELRKSGINGNPTISQLDDGVTFAGLSVAGWCIRLGNHTALNLLCKLGYNFVKAADVAGNSVLHLVARYGTAAMVDIALTPDDVLIEKRSKSGTTAMMEAAKSDNYRVARRLVSCHGNARDGLSGKYCSWLLVLARRQESVHRSLQTGRIGEDDAMYFPAPEPSWYEDAMRTTLSANE